MIIQLVLMEYEPLVIPQKKHQINQMCYFNNHDCFSMSLQVIYAKGTVLFYLKYSSCDHINSYALLIGRTYDFINNLKTPEGHLHYIPMECKESIKATTVNLLAYPTGNMFPFFFFFLRQKQGVKGGKPQNAI